MCIKGQCTLIPSTLKIASSSIHTLYKQVHCIDVSTYQLRKFIFFFTSTVTNFLKDPQKTPYGYLDCGRGLVRVTVIYLEYSIY